MKEFNVEVFGRMIDKVVLWNSIGGNYPENKELEEIYLTLSREEMFSNNEFLQGWFTKDWEMICDGLADLVFTVGFLGSVAGNTIKNIDTTWSYESTEQVIADLSHNLIDFNKGYSKPYIWEKLYHLCLKLSEFVDVESVFEAVYKSNMSKYLHEAELGNVCLDEEVRLIEDQGRYSGVAYHKVGEYFVFTALRDEQSGVDFPKAKIVKPSVFKEPQELIQFVY